MSDEMPDRLDPSLLARLDQCAAALGDPDVVKAATDLAAATASYYNALIDARLPHAEAIGSVAAQSTGTIIVLSGGDPT